MIQESIASKSFRIIYHLLKRDSFLIEWNPIGEASSEPHTASELAASKTFVMIAEKMDADTVRTQTLNAYLESYDECIKSYDFTGKTVISFCTHTGSGLIGKVSKI